jgi:DNA-binding response OmpR family regulator/HPt (histidine-containing phosphotransfer) domain-containing protein
MKILVVEDDQLMVQALNALLSDQTYTVEVASDGASAWQLLQAYAYDLVMLDLTLPQIDGLTLCRRIRDAGEQMPILMLTGREEHHDRALGLDAGADDYVTKPFDPEELLARVRALLRRSSETKQTLLSWGELHLDPAACQVTWGERSIAFTPKEYALMELFLRHPKRVFSCGSILDHLWNYEETPGEEAVRTHIKGLRQKLKTAKVTPDPIETVYGIGYRLRVRPQEAPAASIAETPAAETPIAELPTAETLSQPDGERQKMLQDKIKQVWQNYHHQVQGQLDLLEKFLTSVETLGKDFSVDLRQQSIRDAHSLAGSLGTFGLPMGSTIAKKIETLLRQDNDLSAQIPDFRRHLTALQKEVLVAVNPFAAEETPIARPQTIPPQTIVQFNRSGSRLSACSKVLVVDDDPSILAFVEQHLQPWGIEVYCLADTTAFWQVLETFEPDLLILDLLMPNISGLHIAQELRNNERWDELPIVILTAHRDAETINQVFSIGADDFVSKPIVGPELVTRIINRLERMKLIHRRLEQLQDRFISKVQHELRTPLTSVYGALQMLESGLITSHSEQGKELLKIAALDADRLVTIVNQSIKLTP